jgi:hypothetical protein
MDIQHGAPLLRAHFMGHSVPCEPGVEHKDVELSKCRDRGLNDFVWEIFSGDIARDDDAPVPNGVEDEIGGGLGCTRINV